MWRSWHICPDRYGSEHLTRARRGDVVHPRARMCQGCPPRSWGVLTCFPERPSRCHFKENCGLGSVPVAAIQPQMAGAEPSLLGKIPQKG
jgi:hypothetical protein